MYVCMYVCMYVVPVHINVLVLIFHEFYSFGPVKGSLELVYEKITSHS